MTNPERDVLFRIIYELLATTGACDDAGGAEYDRVRAEWIGAGRPEDASSFIRERANSMPYDLMRKTTP